MHVTVVSVDDAAANLAQLVDRASHGEEILISMAGRPVARLTALARRTPGAWRGRVHMSSDFDALPPKITAAFRGQRPPGSS